MKKPQLYCFTLRNFEKTGGGSIRISGILNALANQGVEIHLFTFSKRVDYLHENIIFHQLPDELKSIDKKKFQFSLSFLPFGITNFLFSKERTLLTNFFKEHRVTKPILFFEYLDISMGYFLKKNRLLSDYWCDVHGIAPLEFQENIQKGTTKQKVINSLKLFAAKKLDYKIFNQSSVIIFPSEAVKNYFEDNTLGNKKIGKVVVNESINELVLNQTVDPAIKEKLLKENVFQEGDPVVMFIGDFKPFGGVEDLFDAFKKFLTKSRTSNTKLILIGDGMLYDRIEYRVAEEGLADHVKLLGRIPYDKLVSYQNCADILVCPDRDTEYSQRLPHIKYYDSISSGRIVINGNFRFTDEMNPDECFSLNFEPSSIESLSEVIEYAIKNREQLLTKYQKNSKLARNKYIYKNSVESIYKFLENEN